jgi:hypothetical protein
LGYDLSFVLLILLLYAFHDRLKNPGLCVLACAALSNAIFFVSYNPLQRAGPIFEPHDTPALRQLAEAQRANRHGWLLDKLPLPIHGSVLNGLGFRAISHTLISPQLQFFRERFPSLLDQELIGTFNRYAHVTVVDQIDRPRLVSPDAIIVPRGAFE